MMKTALLSLAMVFASAGFAGPAQATTTLDFDGNICGVAGNEACGNYSQFGQNYGDSAAVDVSYRSVFTGSGLTSENFLKFWSTQYGNLTNVVWGGPNASDTFSEITFTALPGFEVTLLGFDSACYDNRTSCQTSPFSISEIGGSTLASGNLVNPNGGSDTKVFNLAYSNTGYVLRWGPDGYDTGLDNISFVSRAISAVPEPSTWALMILGFGFVGASLRRKRENVRTTVKFA